MNTFYNKVIAVFENPETKAKFTDKGISPVSYIDLYAGQGKFNDNSFGSPMLALNTILESEVINSFHQLKCFFSEIDKTSYFELEKNISYLKSSKKLNPKLNDYIYFLVRNFIFTKPATTSKRDNAL